MKFSIITMLSCLCVFSGLVSPQEGTKTYLSVHLSFDDRPDQDKAWTYLRMSLKDVNTIGLKNLKTLLSEQLPPKMLRCDIMDGVRVRAALETARDSALSVPFFEKADKPAWICWISEIHLARRPKSQDDRRVYLSFDYTMFNNQTIKTTGNGHVEVALDSMSVRDFNEYMMIKIAYPILQNIPLHEIVQAQRISIRKDSIRHEYFQRTRFHVNGVIPTYAKGRGRAGEYFNMEIGSLELGVKYITYPGYSYGIDISFERGGQGSGIFATRSYENPKKEQMRMQNIRISFGYHRLWLSSLETNANAFMGTSRFRTYSDFPDTRAEGVFSYPVLFGVCVGANYFPVKDRRFSVSISMRYTTGSASLSKFDTGKSGASSSSFAPDRKNIRFDNVQVLMGLAMDARLWR
ncbi:hypothetical protein JNM05_01225 [bacterium]|nr:hypothetical protein [bacterium]